MGKLIDTLHRAGKSTTPSIGFVGRSQSAAKTKAAAIVVEVDASEQAIQDAVKAGADVLILPPHATYTAAEASGVAWGVKVTDAETITHADLKALHEKGANFVILPQTTPMRAINESVDHLERVLQVSPPTDDPLLVQFRTLNLIDIDVAVLDLRLTPKDLATLTIESFAKLRVLSETLRFPVIVTVQDIPTAEDVHTLVKLGAQGIWLTNATTPAIAQLRESLENVPREKDGAANVTGLGGTGANR